MTRAFLIILLLAGWAHFSWAGTGNSIKLDYDYQRPGGDYTHFITDSARECARECEISRRCRAFDFYESDHSCWLKNRVYSLRRYDGVISGAKRHHSPRIETVQRLLAQKNYYPGRADGILGRKTRIALENYQYDHRLPVTGQMDTATLISLGLLQPNNPDQPEQRAAAGIAAPVPPPPQQQAPASDTPKKDFRLYVKTIGVAYLQAADNIHAEVLAKIPAGTTLQVLSEDREWCRVVYNNRQGYVLSEAVQKL